jgi:c-di-GMP-related signal transduction protein
MDVLIARQPILDRQRKLYGYELLFRSAADQNCFDNSEASAATLQVLSHTLLSMGENLLGGKKAFINFDEQLLVLNMHLALPAASTVIEILETVKPTQDLVELCKSIGQQGYCLALDDFEDTPDFEPLTRLAEIIKVDLRKTSQQEQSEMLRKYKGQGVLMLAEKVETYAEFEWALGAGYDLFQGYFFARPVVMHRKQIPAVKTLCLRLLMESRKPEPDFNAIENLILQDVSLTYKLLRFANSALFQRRGRVDSVSRALFTIGTENIQRWAALATLPAIATDKPHELIKLSLLRARFCEQMAEAAQFPSPGDAFLMGMFSVLDALVDAPLEEALQDVNLSKDVSEALLGTAGQDNCYRRVYRLEQAYELGEWNEVSRILSECRIPANEVTKIYLEAADWGERVIHGMSR